MTRLADALERAGGRFAGRHHHGPTPRAVPRSGSIDPSAGTARGVEPPPEPVAAPPFAARRLASPPAVPAPAPPGAPVRPPPAGPQPVTEPRPTPARPGH